MLLKWLTYVAVLISIPDCVFPQTNSRSKRSEDYVPCENGWFYFKESCYKISRADDRVNWEKAAENCVALRANLTTIESKEENDFLVGSLLLETQNSAWIGLHDQVNESDYNWHSGSRSQYQNWREGEPSGLRRENEDCVQLLVDFFHDSVGEWNDNDCRHSIGYICEKRSDHSERSPDPRNCSSSDGGGFRYQNSCYHFVSDVKSWEDAEQHCIDNYGGHLITILDKTVDYYLKYIMQDIRSQWIGIKIQDSFQQRWSSGWYVGYKGFNENNDFFKEGFCIVRSSVKVWKMVPCSMKLPFFCEKSLAKVPVLKKPMYDSFCPTKPKGWRDLGGDFCYFFDTSKQLSWYKANFQCMQRGGNLLSIHSEEESAILHPFIHHSHIAAYVGLFRHIENEGEFKWSDGSDLNFVNWDPGEPNSENEMCVEVRASDMKWNDISCDKKRPFFCSVRKIRRTPNRSHEIHKALNSTITGLLNNRTKEAPNSTAKKQLDSPKKSSGSRSQVALIGVVVFSILLNLILIALFCKFRPRISRKRKLSTTSILPEQQFEQFH